MNPRNRHARRVEVQRDHRRTEIKLLLSQSGPLHAAEIARRLSLGRTAVLSDLHRLGYKGRELSWGYRGGVKVFWVG